MTSARLGELKMLQRLVVVLCLVLQSSGSARAWDSEELGTYHRLNMQLVPVLQIRIRDPVPFLSRDAGWVKNKDPEPG
jgi:hypothetical protein